MTTTVQPPKLGELAAFPPLSSTSNGTPAPRRQSDISKLPASTAAGLAGIWSTRPSLALSTMRRDSKVTDDKIVDSRRGSSSLLSDSESDGWSRRNSHWSSVTTPSARPSTANTAVARRSSAYHSPFSRDSNGKDASRLAGFPEQHGAFHPARESPNVEPSTRDDQSEFQLSSQILHSASYRRDSEVLANNAITPRRYSIYAPRQENSSNNPWCMPKPNLHEHDKKRHLDSQVTVSSSNQRHTAVQAQYPVPRQASFGPSERNDVAQLNLDMERLNFASSLHSGSDRYGGAAFKDDLAQQQSLPESPGYMRGSVPGQGFDTPTVFGHGRQDSYSPHNLGASGPKLLAGFPVETKRSQQPLTPLGYNHSTASSAQLLPSSPYNYYMGAHQHSLQAHVLPSFQSQMNDERLMAMWHAKMYNPHSYNVYPRPDGSPQDANLPAAGQPWASPRVMPQRSNNYAAHGATSPLLMDFHQASQGNQCVSKAARRFELRDIYGHMCEFAGDQHGSRFIQQKIETANSEEKSRCFLELQPNAVQLMKDVFGNYVIQKFFEHGDQSQKRILANCMQGQIMDLSLNMYGCRVVQKALEHILVDQQVSMVAELKDNVLRCIRDQHGNHVIQMVISKVPSKHIAFILDSIVGQVQGHSAHAFGCRVVQRLLEYSEEPVRTMLMRELHDCASTLICDQYGNYVTQHVVEHGRPHDRQRMIDLVKRNLIPYSKQKFASNVVEKCIVHGSDEDRRTMMLQFAQPDERRETALPFLLKDGYGNYVVQRLLETLKDPDFRQFVALLEPEIQKARRTGSNKQVDKVAQKMCRPELTYFMYQPKPAGSQAPVGLNSSGPTPPMTANGTPSPESTSIQSSYGGHITPGDHRQLRKGSTPTIEVSGPYFP